MKRRLEIFTRTLLIILFVYAALGGATASGLLSPPYRFMTLGFLAFIVVVWLLVRWRQGWHWHRTPLDSLIILWLVIIGFSMLANLDVWRRIVSGAWFIFVYIGLWYIAQDAIANKGLQRAALVEALLISGAVVAAIGYLQVILALSSGPQKTPYELLPVLNIPRAISTLDNPSVLAWFLGILAPLAAAQVFIMRSRWGKLFWGVYLVTLLILLLLTISRSGLIGAAVGLIAFGILMAVHRGKLSLQLVSQLWQSRSRRTRIALTGFVALLIVGSVLIIGVLVAARFGTVTLRLGVYGVAVQQFLEKPITGHGLFTFGRGLLRLGSTPPDEAHPHATNTVLNVAAELGLPGLLLLILSIVVVARAIWLNWRVAQGNARILLAGAAASLIGLSIMHLLDMLTVFMVIALVSLTSLILAVAPIAPQSARSQRFPIFLLTGMWLTLLMTGVWDTLTYQDYLKAIARGIGNGDYVGAAEQLQPVIAADPTMPIYSLNRGYFLGVAGWKGNLPALDEAIVAFKKFCEQEPYYAPAWANLGALYWQAEQREQALDMMRRAATFAPRSWQIAYNLGVYEETAGNQEAARRAYLSALEIDPVISLYPEWQQTELRRELARQSGDLFNLDPAAKAALLVRNNRIAEARGVWSAQSEYKGSVVGETLDLIFALEAKDQQAADGHLRQTRRLASFLSSEITLHVAEAIAAKYKGDSATARQHLEAARALMKSDPLQPMDDRVGAIAYSQFWRVGLPQYFLPQVYHPIVDPITLQLFEWAQRL